MLGRLPGAVEAAAAAGWGAGASAGTRSAGRTPAPVRFVNEAVAGEWRAVGASRLTVSSGTNNFVESNWAAVQAFQFSADSPPPQAGMWLEGRDVTSYSQLSPSTTAGAAYASYFWAALAIAVERDIPGAASAWTRVTQNITNLASWSNGFIADPRWGVYPRNRS